MNEPKDKFTDLPEEEAFVQDDPPAPAAGEPETSGEAPPDSPGPDGPDEAPDVEPEPEIAPEPEPDLPLEPDLPPEPEDEPAPAPEAEASAAPEPQPEPEPEVAPEPEPDSDPHADLFEDPRRLGPIEDIAAPETDIPVAVAKAAPDARETEPEPDEFGPDPWDDAPASDWARARTPEPEPEVAPEPLEPAAIPVRGPASPAAGELPTDDIKRNAFAVYLLYLGTPIFLGLSPILGAWLAMRSRLDAPEWIQSHYVFQIRTFWISLATTLTAFALVFLPFALGPTLAIALFVWVVARCFVGMVRLHRGEPIFNPQTWTV